jgi:hypothetical protein
VRDRQREQHPEGGPPDVRWSETRETSVDPEREQRAADAEHDEEGLDGHVRRQRARGRTGYAKIEHVRLREWLEAFEEGDGDPSPGLALLAAHDLDLEEDSVRAARRRALLLLAAGGDPHRELELDGRAVESMAADLDWPERRQTVRTALDRLRAEAAGLPVVEASLGALVDDELAWRWIAGALLAEELAEDI